MMNKAKNDKFNNNRRLICSADETQEMWILGPWIGRNDKIHRNKR